KISTLPTPDHNFLNQQKRNIRYIIVAYLYLDLLSKKGKFSSPKALNNIEEAIINTKLRRAMQKKTKKITDLLK
ncbi:MAG: hypothetical protein V1760_01235, partial [Candidatus Peregrinibacteria bacterium]